MLSSCGDKSYSYIHMNQHQLSWGLSKRRAETSAVPNANYCTRLRETLNGGWVTAQTFGVDLLTFFNNAFHILDIPAIYNCVKFGADPNTNPDLTVVYIVAVERVNRAYLFDYFQLRIDVNLVH